MRMPNLRIGRTGDDYFAFFSRRSERLVPPFLPIGMLRERNVRRHQRCHEHKKRSFHRRLPPQRV
jgi:hypothetical protein